MIIFTRFYSLLVVCFGIYQIAQAQNTSFNQRLIIPVEIGMGFVSQDYKALISLQVSPQAAFIKSIPKIRIGGTLGTAYTRIASEQSSEGWTGYIGPKLSYHLSTFNVGSIGNNPVVLGNLSLFGEHLWGSNNVRLYGFGISAEFVRKVTISIKMHRDYEHAATWGLVGISFNPFPKKPERTFP